MTIGNMFFSRGLKQMEASENVGSQKERPHTI